MFSYSQYLLRKLLQRRRMTRFGGWRDSFNASSLIFRKNEMANSVFFNHWIE